MFPGRGNNKTKIETAILPCHHLKLEFLWCIVTFLLGCHLFHWSSKASSGSYWGWNGLHDTRCPSTELLELASSNFRFIVLREGCPLSPLYPGNALSPENWKAILWKCEFMKLNTKPHQKEMDRFSLMLLVSVASFQKKCFWSSGF